MRLMIIALLVAVIYAQHWHYDHVVKHQSVNDFIDGYQKRVDFEHGQ